MSGLLASIPVRWIVALVAFPLGGWAVGWFITTGIGVSTATGWPVYGLSGTLTSQIITAGVLWKLIPKSDVALSPA